MIALAGCRPTHDRIVIGSKNFTEQAVLGELLAQYLEARGFPVERRLYLAGTYVCHQAMLAGRVDMYVEYTGTALTSVLKQKPSGDHVDVYERVRKGYAEQFGVVVTEPLGFDNSFAMIVRSQDAKQFGLRSISDFAQHAPRRRLGVGYEFVERPDGLNGLVRTYDLKLSEAPRVMDLGLIYRALTSDQVDMIAGANTDGLIGALHLTVLEDDRHYFPPYEAVPLVRQGTLDRYPGLRAALASLAGKITEADMRQMNYAVDAEHRDSAEVVRGFLRARKLVPIGGAQ
jgi:osmoprotectant transport system substrate-binding protein